MAGKAGKGGSVGPASNAALQDDEDLMARKLNRRVNFDRFKRKKRPNQVIGYDKSPSPPVKRY